MLFYGNSLNIIDNSIVFNITSFKEGYVRLPALIPPNELGRFTGRDFDIIYADYILNNDFVFKQFFDIIYSLYTGQDVYLIMSEEDWSENLVESIIKLIQQRSGYVSYKINCFEDFLYAKNSSFCPDFNNYFGVYNLDIDKERYTYIIESQRIRNGGQVHE